MLPNFFIVGAAKSGTTSLYRYLGQHPAIYMSPVKEPETFSFRASPPDFTGLSGKPMNDNIIAGWDDYLALFDGVRGETAVGEASTSYLFLPDAAEALRQAVPEARIIILLRHPVDRTYAHYLDHVAALEEDLTFKEALEAEGQRATRGWRWGYRYAAQSRYAEQLERYRDLFPVDQIHVLTLDELQANPAETVRQVYEFLGVEPLFQPDFRRVHNPGGRPRWRWLQRWLYRPGPLLRAMTFVVPRALRRSLRERVRRANLVPDPMQPETRASLLETFNGEVDALERLLDRDLSAWRK